MFSKEVKDLTYTDIEDLVKVRREREGYHLDFKKEIGHPDKAKKEIAKDISSFANSYGGYLIFGVSKEYEITGLDPTMQNKGVDEWLNQVLDTNIEPQVYYLDPKIITIPGSDKVVVVIHVPESARKPHIVTEINKYHIRVNDIAKSANHGQVRDMFEHSRHRTAELNDFLAKRNLLNDEASDFCLNTNSKNLDSYIPEKLNKPKPLILFSLIPKHIKEEKLRLPVAEFKDWLHKNAAGYAPQPSIHLFHANTEATPHLHGVLMKRVTVEGFTRYFEILNNGFIEAGMSKGLTFPYTVEDQHRVAFYLTQTILFEMLFLGFAKRFYDLIKYKDEAILQLSVANILDYNLYGLHDNYQDRITHRQYRHTNTQHEHLKLNCVIHTSKLSEKEILSIAKGHAEKICRAFGLSGDKAFVDDKLGPRERDNIWF